MPPTPLDPHASSEAVRLALDRENVAVPRSQHQTNRYKVRVTVYPQPGV